MRGQRLRNALVVSLVAGAAIAGPARRGRAAAPPASLSLGEYVLVSSLPYDAALDDDTYSAAVTNTGGPTGLQDAVNVTATFYSVSPQVAVVDRALLFGNVRARATARSRDTFTVRKPHGVPLNPAHLRWQIASAPDVILPESWAGTWRLTIDRLNAETGSLISRDAFTDIIRPDDAIGLSLVQSPARCMAHATADRLELSCGLDGSLGACTLKGRAEMSGTLAGDVLEGGGHWILTASGCGASSGTSGERIAVAAARISRDVSGPFESSTTLAAKFLPESVLLAASVPSVPAAITKDDCLGDGWRRLTNPSFASEGQCASVRRDDGVEMSVLSRHARRLGLLVAVGASLGNVAQCPPFSRVPTMMCSTPRLVVSPGSCLLIANPCGDGLWLNLPRVDDLSLNEDDKPDGIAVSTDRSSGVTQRFICASADADLVVDRPIRFVYGHGQETGLGEMVVTTFAPLQLALTATPALADAGQTIDLQLTIDGGVPHYNYAWTLNGNPWFGSPTEDISEGSSPPHRVVRWSVALSESAPMTVTVTDSRGQTATANVTAAVKMTLTAFANPSSILAGTTSTLTVEPHSGVPPYTIAWTPNDALIALTSTTWSASPTSSITYSVTVTDAVGEQATQQVPVTVVPAPDLRPTARFTATWNGVDGVQLDASASTGSSLSYAWTFSWVPGTVAHDGATTTFPMPSGTTGSITLSVTDSFGVTDTLTQSFTAPAAPPPPPPGLAASFTFIWDGVEVLQLNAGGSTGDVVNYLWTFSWEPNVHVSGGSPAARFFAFPGTTGTITLTVTDRGGATAATTRGFP